MMAMQGRLENQVTDPVEVEAKESRLSRFLARRWAVPLVIAGAVAIVTLACLTPDLIARWQLARELDAIRARGEPATLAELGPDMPPGDENAAVLLAEVFELMDASYASEPADWTEFLGKDFLAHRKDAETAVRLHAKTMALAREALMRPRCVFDLDYMKGYGLELPHLSKLMHLVRIFAAEAILNAINGKKDEAADGIHHVVLLASALNEEPLNISKVVAARYFGFGMEALQRVEAATDLSDESRKLLISDLRKLDFRAAATQSLVCERSFLMEIKPSDMTYTRDWLERRYLEFREGLSQAERLRVLRLMGEAIDASRLPPWEARPAATERYAQVGKIMDWQHPPAPASLNDAWRNWLRTFVIMMAARDAAIIGLSCELYRSARGRYPSGLDELAPEFLETVPLDPFTGKPFHYKLRDNGRSFIVYSVGENLTDDGGVRDHKTGKDDIAWEGKQ
jgi:hypothetical protein